MSLKQSAVSGVKWQFINKFFQKVVSILTFAALARILEPSVFGLFALAFTAIDGFHVFKGFGLDSAIIHRKERIQEAAHTAFFIIQGWGIVLFLLCFICAPLLSSFFKNDQILNVVRALGVIFIFHGFSKIPSTLLTKEMKFNILSIIDIIGTLVNSITAIVLALLWQNIWSLVVAYILKQLVISVLARHFSGYRVKFTFDKEAARDLFKFGKYMIGLTFLWYLGTNINNIVVGKILGTTLLGFYALAANIGNFVNTHFTLLVESVMFPAYSKIQHNFSEVKRIYLKTTRFVSFITMPISVLMILFAREFVLALYGQKWIQIIPLIQMFGFIQIVAPILTCSGSLFLGCGLPKYNYRLSLFQLILGTPVTIYLTMKWGITGTVYASMINFFIAAPLNLFLVNKIIKLDWGEFFRQFIPSLLCAGAMWTVMGILKFVAYESYAGFQSSFFNAGLLAIFGILAVTTYIACIALLDRAAYVEFKDILFKKIKVVS